MTTEGPTTIMGDRNILVTSEGIVRNASSARRYRWFALAGSLTVSTGCSESCAASSGSTAAATAGRPTSGAASALAASSSAQPPAPVAPAALATPTVGSNASVLQHHKNATRDGAYIEPAFTKAAAAKLHIDSKFRAEIEGPTFAQPLYFAGGPRGKDVVIVATEQNQVYALDAATGATVWQKRLGSPVSRARLPCGNIETLGITGTPVIDAASRTLFVDAMTTPDDGTTKKHLIFGLSVDDGSTRAGWPIDVSVAVKGFLSAVQSQRGALAVVGGSLYVAYGGHYGDCGEYRGWVVGVPLSDPRSVKSYSTAGRGGGIWAPGGIASDGTSIFVTTGNSFPISTWTHGEAVLRLSAGPAFSAQPRDYFTPSNWKALDGTDADLGSSGPLLVDVPGANPSQLVVALGKNGVGYLVNRANMGGVGTGNGTTGEAIASAKVSPGVIITAAAAYTTPQATYVAIGGLGVGCPMHYGDVTALKISATSPPTLAVAWCAGQDGFGSPIVTTTDGRSDAIVWWLTAEGSNQLMGFDGETGKKIFATSGAGDAMTHITKFNSPIVAKGRIFVASDTRVYAFTTL
jgi:outer membrane protein assembly factor BamB